MKKIVVFFGKGGSNFLNLLQNQKNYKIVLGITNKKESLALKEKNLPPILISEDFDEIFNKLKTINPDLIVLAGFLKILPSKIVNNFKTINIHPSILPYFKGLNADKKSFEAKKGCGITIHWANEELDSGDIILQYHINPNNFKTFKKYQTALKKAEHLFLPAVVIHLCEII